MITLWTLNSNLILLIPKKTQDVFKAWKDFKFQSDSINTHGGGENRS